LKLNLTPALIYAYAFLVYILAQHPLGAFISIGVALTIRPLLVKSGPSPLSIAPVITTPPERKRRSIKKGPSQLSEGATPSDPAVV